MTPDRSVSGVPVAVAAVVGAGLLGGYWLGRYQGWQPAPADYLAVMTMAFLTLLLAAVLWLFGSGFVRRFALPVVMMVFMVPYPTVVREWIETFFQRGSALAAHGFLALSGMPVLRQGMYFHLPGFDMEVAPECSGIHSSLVLFITSLLAGHLFLRTPSRRTWLTLAVIPLALARNGIRIFTISQLCVQISPDMINSYIHRRGGPIFFALSLIPFFFLLFYLRRSEEKAGREHK